MSSYLIYKIQTVMSLIKQSVKNGVVNNALIYGHNGVGKSNLGLALFDIIGHLTDSNTNESEYYIYLNALSKAETAKFKYEFLIDSKCGCL